MPVDRCICHKISFSEIKQIAGKKDFRTVEKLRAENICSTQCKLCEPYVEKVLETGEVSFQSIIYTE